MFCKFVKLTNGEDIIVSTDDPCTTFLNKEFIDVVDPVALGTVRIPRPSGIVERFVMYKWLKLSKPDIVRIPIKSILLVTDLDDSAQLQYQDFIQGKIELQHEPQSMEELVQHMFEDMEDDEESEEDDYNHSKSIDGRTLH